MGDLRGLRFGPAMRWANDMMVLLVRSVRRDAVNVEMQRMFMKLA
jgi:hypothetical protein